MRCLFFGFFLCGLVLQAHGQPSALYRVRLPVQNTSEKARNSAFFKSFPIVLKRLTAAVQVPHHLFSRLKQRELSHWIEHYRYEQTDAGRWIDIHYRPEALLAYCQKEHLSAWPQQRPVVLFWVVDVSANGLALLDSDSESDLKSLFKQEASAYALPSVWPVLSAHESDVLSAEEMFTPHMFPLFLESSKQYHPDAIVFAKWSVTPKGEWTLTWRLQQGTLQENGTFKGMSQKSLAQKAFQHWVQWLKGKELLSKTTQAVLLRVTDIQNLQDLEWLKKRLKALYPVKSVSVANIHAQSVLFRLDVSGNATSLEHALKMEPHWLAVPFDTKGEATDSVLTYRWLDF